MIPIQFTEDQYDMLKEVVNQAMGKAGSDLARILESFVDLVVPDIEIVAAEHVVDKILLRSVFNENEAVTLFRQSFSNPVFVTGESIVVFNHETHDIISEILGFTNPEDKIETLDFMMELSNLMVGACVNSISEQLFSQTMSFSPPEMVSENKSLQESVYEKFKRRKLKWDYTLLSKITFTLKDKSFKSDLIIFIPQEAIQIINDSLDKLLAEYE